jgi:hypothetical protein
MSTQTREVGSVLARVVKGLGLTEVPECGCSGLTKMESGPAEFHVPEYRVGRIPKLLRQPEDLCPVIAFSISARTKVTQIIPQRVWR